MFNFQFPRDLTPQELMKCKTLQIDSTGGQTPTIFESKHDFKLVKSQTIILEDIYLIYPEIREYLMKIINLWPNLIDVSIRIAYGKAHEI